MRLTRRNALARRDSSQCSWGTPRQSRLQTVVVAGLVGEDVDDHVDEFGG